MAKTTAPGSAKRPGLRADFAVSVGVKIDKNGKPIFLLAASTWLSEDLNHKPRQRERMIGPQKQETENFII